MGWPYQFIDLTDTEKGQRRELLDSYAALAQWSFAFPVIAMQCWFGLTWSNGRRQNQRDLDSPGSPSLKVTKLRSANFRERARVFGRKVQWWMGGEQRLGDVEGTRGQILFALAWLAWLFWLCFRHTGKDYLHLTKRFGIVAASQLPCHYLLAIKTPHSPLQLVTQRTHETLNVYHRLLGKAITVLLYTHAIFYLNFYIQKSLLATKLQEAYVLCGIVGIVAFRIISFPPNKHKSYRIFYIAHITLASLLLPLLFFHVSHVRIYLYESAAVYALNILLRHKSSITTTATVNSIFTGSPDTRLVEITIPLSQSSSKTLQSYNPAQHTYLSLPHHPLSRAIHSNPFTLASVPTTDNKLQFYARIQSGNTAALAAAATNSTFPPSATGTPIQTTVTLEGPYGLTTHPDNLLLYDRILFVAGGIGATFIVPLYRQLLADLSPSPGSRRRGRVQFIWTVKRAEETFWAVPDDEAEREGFRERAEIFVTGGVGTFSAAGDAGARRGGGSAEEEAIELQERSALLSDEEGKDSRGVSLRTGRPDLRAVVDATFSHCARERVAVMVCGPKSLSRDLRGEVGRWVMERGRDVWFWEESFGT